MAKTKMDLKLFMKQGNSYLSLLEKTNRNGQHNKKIADIKRKMLSAKKQLQLY
ncbi:hypothetical protein MFMK1_000945 [Metallumcola ferriviriculae]|uniref:Ribosomal protein L29 n=1 Tax=Metallumcola ferriviriculae TaxID=3039180 RepID=A0AAU0ULV0_9FIRM|nr:hypothetical protein MFMK1_000945 [Desulfitibacteraceae bacterium MK1]